MLHKLSTCGLLICLSLSVSSCYRFPVPQGNVISSEMASRIKPGMTEFDVVSILGSPVIDNVYANDQMAYVYTLKKGISKMSKQRMIIYFKDKRVVNVESDYQPAKASLPEPD